MNNRKACPTDESIVDFVLANVNLEQQIDIQTHLNECENCQVRYHMWTDSLQVQDQQFDSDRVVPSESLKDRVMRSVAKPSWQFFSWPKLRIPVGFLAAVCLFLALVPLLKPEQGVIHKDPLAEAEQLMTGTPFVLDSETEHYEVMPVSHHRMKGYVWVNNNKNEMFLVVEGLLPLQENDYQAWLRMHEHHLNAGLLTINNDIAHLYVQDYNLSKVNRVKVSIEPKGGSIHPMGPESFFVELNHWNQ